MDDGLGIIALGELMRMRDEQEEMEDELENLRDELESSDDEDICDY